MLSTVEKVLALKAVDLFTRLSGEDLAGIAVISRLVPFEPGETVFEEGELGDALYVVLEGKVRVHREERTVAEIGPAECFGEMALLDSAPRSASVTALVDTSCLRIDREDFSDILTEKPQIAQGVIRVLTRRLRGAIEQPIEGVGG
jgi:CRP-like cAMP-binding protein